MVKYRRLSLEELEELREEFIHFLAVNGIDAKKWQDIKVKNKKEADQFIDSFSDAVLEKSLQNIKYIEHRTASDYKVFFYDETEAQMIGVKSNSVDLTDENWHKNSFNYLEENKISLLKGTKKYAKSRSEELFSMLQQGCLPAEQKMFSLLKKITE